MSLCKEGVKNFVSGFVYPFNIGSCGLKTDGKRPPPLALPKPDGRLRRTFDDKSLAGTDRNPLATEYPWFRESGHVPIFNKMEESSAYSELQAVAMG